MNAHPAAELFPLMSDTELRELAEDIKAHGQHEPIKTFEGMILDGRNRHRACQMVNVQPWFEEWQGKEPTAYVLSENLHRRHLTVSQIAAIGVEALPLLEAEASERQKLLGRTHGNPSAPIGAKGRATEIVSAQLGGAASPRTIQRAKQIKDNAPDVFEEIKRGEITVEAGLRKADLPASTNGRRNGRVSKDKRHKEVMRAAEAIVRVGERWDREMTDELTPPQARKQLTVLNNARIVIEQVTEAVEYRAATLHSYNVSRR